MKKQLLKEIIEKKEKKIEFAIITNLENGAVSYTHLTLPTNREV